MNGIKELQEKIITALGVLADNVARGDGGSIGDRAYCTQTLTEALRVTELVRTSREDGKKPPV